MPLLESTAPKFMLYRNSTAVKEDSANSSQPLECNDAAAEATASAAKTADAARQQTAKLGDFFEEQRAVLETQRIAAKLARAQNCAQQFNTQRCDMIDLPRTPKGATAGKLAGDPLLWGQSGAITLCF